MTSFLRNLAAAIVFYTRLPVPAAWLGDFEAVAKFAPIVGLLIGGMLAAIDGLLAVMLPNLTRSAIVILVWIAITGGLHLDGAIDTADGMAVPDAERRLEVMADSAAGAFGVMAAVAIVALKIAALSDLHSGRGWILLLACGWGRWGQQMAIARYPYLKATGKGAFHKAAIQSNRDTWPSLGLLLSLCGLVGWSDRWLWSAAAMLGSGIAVGVGAVLNDAIGGHTGDTYGATVEWTEALFLVAMTGVASSVG
ncbi:adenosylcobinamide-GDP ribazoletransferase [Microcoleus sp. FACHB-1515]|uniref:adenosylcobinamide-GDP ribazoletransferase n=1 Tax=Cyanophyceae TaxID=3028117 RepID=UPI001F551173|nr:adenosylcobinamide-GDP ribazoletransferase [Microcoleus sp. FACHB-1515]